MVSCEEIRGTFLCKLKFLVIKLYKIVVQKDFLVTFVAETIFRHEETD